MKKNILIICMLLVVSICEAQTEMNTAHFRTFRGAIDLLHDTRFPSLMLKPEIEMKLLRGMIEMNGHYCFQLLKLESWDKEISDPKTSLVGKGYDMPYAAYEVQLGFNFFSRYNQNATLLMSMASGNWTFYWLEPGSKAYQFGVHGGFGAFRSKIGIYDHLFDLETSDGRVLNESNSSNPNDYYNYDTYSNVVQEYLFAGIHYNLARKQESRSDKVRGGDQTTYYADVILPQSTVIGTMYSPLNVPYKPIPKEGDNWTKTGYRVGVKRSFSATVGFHLKMEVGQMPSYSTYGAGAESLYFSIGLGMGISPVVLPVELPE